MASRDDYTVGWVCALPVEMAAAKATLDRIHPDIPSDLTVTESINYILGSLNGHNVVVAYPIFGAYGTTSIADVTAQLRESFKFLRFNLFVGIGGGVPSTEDDIRLGDIVVSKPTTNRPGLVQYDFSEDGAEGKFVKESELNQPSALLLTATGKTKTAEIFGESRIPLYIFEAVQKDPHTFACPGPEQDVLFYSDHDHVTVEPAERGCDHCNPDKICPRPPRETLNPKVHYGLVASCNRLIPHAAARDKLAQEEGILCFETEVAGMTDAGQCLVIRGICDYADSHRSELWHGYAAAVAAAYAKELLSFIHAAPRPMSQVVNTYAVAVPVLDALLLTRPEVDRTSLIALKGRRVAGTCEWLTQHPSYQKWLMDASPPLLWISGGPGKGKTMLAIYITEILQPVVDSTADVLLYYFCSNRDKNRNTAVTIMRGIIHQWLTIHPDLAQYVKHSFEGTDTTKYTISSFISLWRVFVTLLQQIGSHQVVCVLDGLDECEKEPLKQLLDAVENYLSTPAEGPRPRLKLIFLSRPQPIVLEEKLDQYQRIKLDHSDKEISADVERYIFAKVAELASEQDLSEEIILQVQQALLAGAEGTFLWVGFVANELKGRDWREFNDILRGVPKGLGGIYQRLLQQVEGKENLVLILRWIVLAARPLTVDELTMAAEIKEFKKLEPREVTKSRLESCGLLVKIEGEIVNLVHESAKEFFQGKQVDIDGIRMFRMNEATHLTLARTCLALIERNYGSPGSIGEKCLHNSLLAYACLYWPEHLQHAMRANDARSEFSRSFFQAESPAREEWWKFYWEHEKNGGAPPSFTLLHLAAYLGNKPWAEMLINEHSRSISKKDNYGRTPLSWAVNRGHRQMVEFLLDHGARVNAKDRSKLTALHVAITGEHKDIVSLLLERHARLEARANAGDTPLIRAIQANSEEIVELLLEHGARVDELPTPPGVAVLKGPAEPVEERAEELLELREQLFASRYKQGSRRVGMYLKAGSLSFRFPLFLQLITLYVKFIALSRYDSMSVLQELVKENKRDELRTWASRLRKFYVQLVTARNPRRLAAMTGLPTAMFEGLSTTDLKALLVMGVLVGSETLLAAARQGWREGDTIIARAFAAWVSIAYRRDAQESLHYGVREFLIDFDGSIQRGDRKDNVARTVVLFTSHFAILETQDPQAIEYFSTVIAEFYEGYIGGSHEDELFSDANRACANELAAISEGHDYTRLHLFLTSILQFAQRSREKGQDRFLNMVSASCLILCQNNANAHRWLIGEAIPETMSGLISQQDQAILQKRIYKALVECMIIGKQYGLALPTRQKKKVEQHLKSLVGDDFVLVQILEL